MPQDLLAKLRIWIKSLFSIRDVKIWFWTDLIHKLDFDQTKKQLEKCFNAKLFVYNSKRTFQAFKRESKHT